MKANVNSAVSWQVPVACSRGWLIVSRDAAGVGHELFECDGVLYVAMLVNGIDRDGYRRGAGRVGSIADWPRLRRDILEHSCAGWTHEESAESRRLAGLTAQASASSDAESRP